MNEKKELKNTIPAHVEKYLLNHGVPAVDRIYKSQEIDFEDKIVDDPDVPALSPFLVHQGSYLKHVRQYNDALYNEMFEDGYPKSPFVFFSYGATEPPRSYWGHEGISLVYHAKRPLVLLYLPQFKLRSILESWGVENLGNLPWNLADKSDPHGKDDDGHRTYAWDYMEMEIMCKVFGVDGVVRKDEVVLCGPFEDKLTLCKTHSTKNLTYRDMPEDERKETPTPYYQLTESSVAKIKSNTSVRELLHIIDEIHRIARELSEKERCFVRDLEP